MQRKPEGEILKNNTLWAGVVIALLTACLAASSAEEAKTMSSSTLSLPYVHLYADSNGVSHFRDERLAFTAAAADPSLASPQLSNARAITSRVLSKAPGATLLVLKRGAEEDWHRAPRRMYLIVVQGMSEVTAGDGEVRRFGLGSLLLMDDTTGKGHITRAVGDVDHVALTIPAPSE